MCVRDISPGSYCMTLIWALHHWHFTDTPRVSPRGCFLLLFFLDPKRRKRCKFSQWAGTSHTGPGVCRRHQLIGAPDGAARGHPRCSAAGAQAQREGLSWTQLQQGAVKILPGPFLFWPLVKRCPCFALVLCQHDSGHSLAKHTHRCTQAALRFSYMHVCIIQTHAVWGEGAREAGLTLRGKLIPLEFLGNYQRWKTQAHLAAPPLRS